MSTDEPEAFAATVGAGADTVAEQDGVDAVAHFHRGSQFGKYVVLDRIGAGGAGIVVAAYDPDLDRKVAIKLLRGQANETGRARLVREARALAQLNHPNVITVHEVGTYADEVFVAMEFAAGGTLGAWLRETPRSWPDILDRFLQAGAGLAAAHAAHLVHRDFKPENVLVFGGGRVKVSDFGLVGVASSPVEVGDADHALPASTPLSTSLTRTGMLLGTPVYMAPEQHRFGRVDARADQFSFCVALWESAYGQRPFPGDDYVSLLLSVSEGRMTRPPRSPETPASLLKVLRRGLSTDPAARWESMDALLAALRPVRAATRGRYLTLAGVLVAALAGSLVFATRSHGPGPCANGARRLTGIWDDATKQKIRAAFAASGAPSQADDWGRVERIVDDYTRGWEQAQRDNCEATRVDGDQTEQAFALRETCLEYRLTQLSGLTSSWSDRVDAAVVRASTSAAIGLDALSICNEASALSDRLAPPSDEASTRAIVQIRRRLADGEAQFNARKLTDAQAVLEPLRAEAIKLGYPPLVAEVELQLANLDFWMDKEQAASDLAFDAALRAQSARYGEVAAEAWRMLSTVEIKQRRPDEAERWLRVAQATADAVADQGLRGRMLLAQGNLRSTQGRLEEARTLISSACDVLARYVAHAGGDVANIKHQLATARSDLGSVLMTMGRTKEAEEVLLQAIADFDALYGPRNMPATVPLNTLAGVYYAGADYTRARATLGRALEAARLYLDEPNDLLASYESNLGELLRIAESYDEAIQHLNAALTARRALFGDDDARLVPTYQMLAVTMQDRKDLRAALPLAQKAVDLATRKLGDKDEETAVALVALGSILTDLGKYESSIAACRHALRIYEAIAPDNPDIAVIHHRIGLALHQEHKYALAIVEYRAAMAILDRSTTPPPTTVRDVLGGLARSYLALGQLAAAVPPLEQAVELTDRAIDEPAEREAERATTRFLLARALWDANLDRARALREAGTAVAECERAASKCEVREPIAAWVAAHPH